jgi:tRNA-2-methylthio-N6-dimethylallyladenosine synthase
MDDRLQRLQAALNQQHQARSTPRAVGQDLRRACCSNARASHPGQLLGKSPWLQSVHLTAPGPAIGDLVQVRIDSAGPNSLGGVAV